MESKYSSLAEGWWSGTLIGLSLAASAILVFLNGVFVGYEFAILKSSSYGLESLAAAGRKGAALAMRHKERVNEYLAVCQLGITAVTLALTVAFEPAVEALAEPLLKPYMSPQAVEGVSLGIALFVATTVHVTFGELVPKSLALIAPEKLVARFSRVVEYLYRIGRPPIWLFNGVSTWLAKVVTGRPVSLQSESIDIHEALVKSHRSGKIDESQFELLDAVLDYRDRMVREVMTPRSELVYVDPAAPIEETFKTVTENYYSRYPVISDGAVKGYVVIHDLFAEPDPKQINWKKITRPLPRVPETLTLPRAHRAMKGSPIAAVFDEYNQFVGIITHSDIDEEIIGELLDEDDDDVLPLIQPDGEGGFIVSGVRPVDDVLEALGIEASDEELDGIDSFGGLLLTHLGREPVPGDTLEWGGYSFTIEEADRFRILRVRAKAVEEKDKAPPGGARQ